MLSTHLGDKAFWRTALRLALPIAFQNMLTGSFALIDTMMVSRLGDVSLSAVGMAGQWSWFMTIITFGVCSGMSVFAAQYWGIRDLKGMRRVLGLALVIGVSISLLFLIGAVSFPERIIRLFNQDPRVVAEAVRYIRIACFSYPAVVLNLILSAFLRNIEKVRVPMYVALVTTALNAFLNYGFIFGAFFFPKLGVRGAAVATCISAWTGPVLLLLISLLQRNHMVQCPQDLLSFRRSHIAAFFKRAAPVMLNEFVWGLGVVVMQMIYSNMGYEYYAAVAILKTFVDLSFAFFVGLGNACVIMVGKSVGAGRIEQSLADARRFALLVPLLSLFAGLLLAVFRAPLVATFNLSDNISPRTVETALAITLFCALELALRNVAYIQVVGIFRSGGDTFYGMVCDIGSLWAFAIPAAALCAYVFHLPFLTVFIIAYLVEDIPKTVLCLHRFFSNKWLKPVTAEGRAGLEAFRQSKQQRLPASGGQA
ncbi:MAG: MATE family efflux transporter [Clostridia bacterium]|nr:MATE family efflux transporter [Clostridia bacterium]MBR3552722.1 MATE family efflux transporter [Clostridia bacterium]